MNEAAKLTRGSIRGHLVAQTAPMIFGVAAMLSVSLIDAYFIGQLGAEQLAAISFIFPISVALSSLGVGVMVGINSVVSRALGRGDGEDAMDRASLGIVYAVSMGLATGLALYALLDPLFSLMQADEELLPLIRAYMQPFAIGFPLLMTIMGINGVLRGQGEANRTSAISFTYAAANWVLDPILITGAFGIEGMGIAGAAYASNIGWAVAGILGFILLRKTGLPFHPSRLGNGAMGRSIKAISQVAGPAAFSNAINPIGLAILTALIANEGQAAVAGFGAAGRLQSFAVVPLLALSGSIGSIVGQNWGADKADRALSGLKGAFVFCIGYGLVIAALLVAFAEWFADLFTQDPEVIAQFAAYLHIAAWGYAGFGLLIVANGALNSVGRSQTALLQSAARVFLIMLPVAFLLRGMLGADAMYGAELAANAIGGIVAAIIAWRVIARGP